MRRGAAGRDLRPSDAPILVLSSTPPPYPSREPATLATHGDCKRGALGGGGGKCSLRHAALLPAVAVPRRLNMFLWRARGHSNSGQPVGASNTTEHCRVVQTHRQSIQPHRTFPDRLGESNHRIASCVASNQTPPFARFDQSSCTS